MALPLPGAQIGLDDLRVVLNFVGRALGDDVAEVQHADALTDAHDQAHIVFNEQDGDLEGVADLYDILHELGGLGGVHAGRGLIQEQQGGIGGQGADDLQAALGAVGETARLGAGQILHVENGQQFQCTLMGNPLLLPVPGQTEHPLEGAIFDVIVEADLHIVLHAEVGEQPDVLEGTGDPHAVDLDRGLAGGVYAVEQDGAPGGLINLG